MHAACKNVPPLNNKQRATAPGVVSAGIALRRRNVAHADTGAAAENAVKVGCARSQLQPLFNK